MPKIKKTRAQQTKCVKTKQQSKNQEKAKKMTQITAMQTNVSETKTYKDRNRQTYSAVEQD